MADSKISCKINEQFCLVMTSHAEQSSLVVLGITNQTDVQPIPIVFQEKVLNSSVWSPFPQFYSLPWELLWCYYQSLPHPLAEYPSLQIHRHILNHLLWSLAAKSILLSDSQAFDLPLTSVSCLTSPFRFHPPHCLPRCTLTASQ